MSNFRIMTSVSAYYEPQDGQSFRCSINFPHWDTPAGEWSANDSASS